MISDKQDWIDKCVGKIDETLFNITYSDIVKSEGIDGYDAVLPLYEKDIVYLQSNFNHLNGSRFLLPSIDTINICENKADFSSFLNQNYLSKFSPLINKDLSPPFILKKKIDEYGENSHVILDSETEKRYIDKINSPDYFKQEYVIGNKEFTTHFIFKGGEFTYLKNLSFLFKTEYYVKGIQNPSTDHSIISNSDVFFVEILSDILIKLKYEGVGCFNYKIKNDTPKIFEINPRPGGSLPRDVNNFLMNYYNSLNNK